MKIIAIVICALALALIPDSALQDIFDVGFEAASSISQMILEAGQNLVK